ncbi:MAG: MATE family efflux transporter [Clostridiales bacterium]|nr:MAG: MATE family efflux transporter [Clostridiales bacterium]
MDSNILGSEKISKLLLKMSIPATVGMIVNGLYNVVDTIFIGRGVGPLAIGGITVAFPIQLIVMAFAFMVGIGTGSSVSRNLGKKDFEAVKGLIANSFILTFIISFTISILLYFNIDSILRLFGATDTLIVYSKEYMSVIIFGIIFYSIAVNGYNIVRAHGKAKAAMFSMIIGTGLNIILDPIFIFVFKLGIRGAAFATIISQFCSFVYVIIVLLKSKEIVKAGKSDFKFNSKYASEILKVGFPSFMRQVTGSLIALVVNNSIVRFGGDIALSAYGVINRVIMFSFMPMFGVVQGAQPIIGYNYGASKNERVIETIKIAIKFLVAYASIVTISILLFSNSIFGLFTDDPVVGEIGVSAMRIIVIAIPIIGIQVISSSVYQALGYAKQALFLVMLRQVMLLLPLILIIPNIFGLELMGVWVSFPISDLIATFISSFMLKGQINKFRSENVSVSS